MKNILLPTDYSTYANNAFLYALNLANKLRSKLYVMSSYVAPVISAVHAGQPEMVHSVYQEIENSRREYASVNNKNLIKLAQENNLPTDNVEFVFKHGAVLSSVHQTLSEHEISLIVMGVYGESGFKGEFLGSNTTAVIRNVKLPVLAIPLDASYSPIQNIAFTTLFKEKDFSALQQIIEISELVNAKVYCIHVGSDQSNTTDVLLQSENWIKTFKEKDIEFVFLEKENTLEETINRFIIDKNIDVIAIVRRNRNLFDRLIRSSLSTKLTFHTEIPIFVFHQS